MAFDREAALKKAEKLLRQGKLDAAIAEYARIVEDQPSDWMTTNTLGDLYVRAGQSDQAAAQYSRIAEHFMEEGFYPKASALYKKLLKLTPDDEGVQLALADISQKQGLLADAKTYFNGVAARRQARGDKAGAAEIVVRLGSLDPNDFEARLAAARTLASMGDEEGAAAKFRAVYEDLAEKDRPEEGLDALREAVRLNPHDAEGRLLLARAAVAAGDVAGARAYLDRESAGADPALLTALLRIELEGGTQDEARAVAASLFALGPEQREKVVELAWSVAESRPDGAYVLVDAAVDDAVTASRYTEAAEMLRQFGVRVPDHIPSLMKLIEVCVDGGLEPDMCAAQAQLADAYLNAGQATEARFVAEDLVAREPWERAHIDRFRRALVMLKVSDPDSLIAERLSGETPFIANDPFADARPAASEAAAAQPASQAVPEPLRAAQEPAQEASNGAPAAAAAPAPPPRRIPVSSMTPTEAGDEIDLSGALGGLQADGTDAAPAESGTPPAADAVFQEFRHEVSRQSGADQSAQHMTLARTYLEMGMPDEAVASLVAASRAPQFRFEAASRLGRIYRDKGDTPKAVEWLERAAEAPAPGLDEGRALLYDLGALVEQSGDTARALAIFLELQSDAGDYRDVAQRVERLTRVEAGG